MKETTVQAGRQQIQEEARPSFHDENLPLTGQDLFEVLWNLGETERRRLPVRITCGPHGTPRPLLAAAPRWSPGSSRMTEIRLVVRSK